MLGLKFSVSIPSNGRVNRLIRVNNIVIEQEKANMRS